MDDLLSEFLTETSESLSTLDVELVNLEQNPNDRDILSNIFRLVHTIKGTCGFLGLPRLESLAHAAENVLGKFRDGELEVTPAAVTLILTSIDRIKEILAHLEQTEQEPEGTDEDLKTQLNAAAEGRLEEHQAGEDVGASAEPEGGAGDDAAADAGGDEAGGGPVLSDAGFPVAAELLAEVEAATASGKKAASEDELAAEMAAEMEKEAAAKEGAAAAPPPKEEAKKEQKSEAKPPAPAAKPPAKAAQPPAKQGAGGGGGAGPEKKGSEPSIASQSIRVSVELLENLMTLVSELVLTRNQLLQMVRGRDDSEFTAPLQRLSHITSDLQEGVMKTRMQPIGNAWAKLPRIVRDLSIEMGKKIDLQMYGAETELDRQVLELIKDPLTHMVRNSADHGLEDTEGRIAAGKPETGVVKLNAYHEGGHIIIEISDDGRGLNIDKIRDKAIMNGLATEAEMDNLTDQQVAQFIFKAGLSTAEKVTSVSGRGVGMDVVRTNIERIGGTVELKTWPGKGSTFTIKIPLTLAIVSALIVECAHERFAIPQISVLELVRVTKNSETGIEMISDAPVLRLRDRLLPLVSLGNLLKLRKKTVHEEVEDLIDAHDGVPAGQAKGKGKGKGNGSALDKVGAATNADGDIAETFIVVTQVGTYTFGIIVDRVFDTEEIVVKPVAPILRHISMFSGNTILGDGSVIMILDPNGIATATGEVTMGTGTAAESTAQHDARGDDRTSLLVFRAGGKDLKAVPLALVARLEEVDCATVEHSYGKPVVQYRGQLMPLVTVNQGYEIPDEGRQPVLVFSDRDRSMGLVVDEIVDIVEDRLKVELKADKPGVIGTAIIGEKATDVIDTGYYLTQAFGDWFGNPDESAPSLASGKKRVLLVDDSPFFRNLLTPLLSVAGYDVTSVDGPQRALEMREQGHDFDAIISDIEMPGMDGFGFAEAVRADGRWADLPMVALSSHATQKDFERGRQVGFDDYVTKFDRDALLETLKATLGSRS
ncbi:Signal transduction histidine kinase CheA [Caenispirillum salinarum AK4]|uniref:Chemotaxis protein CheA n=1 Tax=Caenispirillum salinarum AK4 TaxID=1238182 RepID=K9H296_9PROT|nr:chemotaxis protein CheW [Caenispirillum salinarum]EKV31672.1 Signal transduction histidine kinase CheA [Caenispirillum salinarum AK4]